MLTYVHENVDLHTHVIYNDFHMCECAFTHSSNISWISVIFLKHFTVEYFSNEI